MRAGRASLAGIALALVALSLPDTAMAEGMTSSLRPKPRPVQAAVSADLPAVTTVTTENTTALRPRPRPAGLASQAPVPVASDGTAAAATGLRPRPRPAGLAAAAQADTAAPAGNLVVSVFSAGSDTARPKPRPAGLNTVKTASAAAAAAPAAQEQAGKRGGLLGALFGNKNAAQPRNSSPTAGSVCGDPVIQGEDIAAIPSKVKGCGVDEPVRVTAIDGIRLNTPATINCQTATALRSWVDNGLRPNVKGEVVELRIAASYICRPRNNIKGNKISEHGRGNAVDVAGVVLSDGSLLTVADNFSKLRKAYKAACGTFGTTLGPGSDGYHEDHMHFDTASYRSGAYCR